MQLLQIAQEKASPEEQEKLEEMKTKFNDLNEKFRKLLG